MRIFAKLLAAALIAVPVMAADAPLGADEAAIKAHVAFLAADALRGREAGTADYRVAADYVAARMLAAGLEPAGSEGWFQPVPLATARLAAEPVMTLTAGGASVPLTFGSDFTAVRSAPGSAAVDVDAAVVFAAHGVVDAASKRDDYRGLDVRGKIVALLYTGPVGPPSEVAAHLGDRVGRARVAAARGAAGVVFIESGRMTASFATLHGGWDATSVTWVGPDGRARDGGARALGLLSQAGAAKLFAGGRLSLTDVLAADTAGRVPATGPLPGRMRVQQRFTTERVSSPNVVGRLRGSDPSLRDEHIVLSAHLDHVGVTARPVKGDAIHNGALDNAMGIASMLEVARRFGEGAARPKRSILFVAVTAEEKGLIGSDYFATYPTVPRAGLAANVNLDMPILLYRFRDLVALGADRSSIGPIAAAAVQAAGFTLVPDPTPEQASFVRTDHYSFVRQGIPSVSLKIGPGNGGAEATARFLRDNYHKPSDEIGLPIDWTAAKDFVGVKHAIARALADAPARPRWNKGDYFGTLYKGPMAR
jgi:Zn-dependent M28 family amino/carboxypeptidase